MNPISRRRFVSGAGAVLGATLGELWLLERLGMHGTAFVAAGCNLLAAVGALAASRRLDGVAVERTQPTRAWPDASARRLLLAAFLLMRLLSGGAVLLWLLSRPRLAGGQR